MGRRRMKTYRANLITLWEHWVVEVPDAGGVHAIVLESADAEEVARTAIATLLDLDPASIKVIVQSA